MSFLTRTISSARIILLPSVYHLEILEGNMIHSYEEDLSNPKLNYCKSQRITCLIINKIINKSTQAQTDVNII